jgi:CheY-like chemotaxis protein
MLAKHFAVTAAASGEEALALCAQELPDLVLLDVTMPGLDGYQTCRLLRERHPRVPIIFVTACQTLDEHLHAFEAGGDDLIKPVEWKSWCARSFGTDATPMPRSCRPAACGKWQCNSCPRPAKTVPCSRCDPESQLLHLAGRLVDAVAPSI